MAIAPELDRLIETQLEAISPDKFRRPGISNSEYIDAFTSFVATAKKDETSLVAAGLPQDKFAYIDGLQEKLLLTFGARHSTLTDTPEERKYCDEQMAIVEDERKKLLIVCDYIADVCGDPAVRKNYQFIVKGSSAVDSLTDVVLLVMNVRQFLQLASQIRPEGVLIDEAFCTRAHDRAVELLGKKGIIVEKGVPKNAAVNKLNRIITLCVTAQSEIKRFAYAAFYKDPKYYEDNYIMYKGNKVIESTVIEPSQETAPAAK